VLGTFVSNLHVLSCFLNTANLWIACHCCPYSSHKRWGNVMFKYPVQDPITSRCPNSPHVKDLSVILSFSSPSSPCPHQL
jgi:hypothetical protein